MRLRDRLPGEESERLVDKRLAESRGAPFVEGLLASLDTADRGLKESLVRVLGMIGDERSIGGLLRCCRDERLRGFVLQAVGRMGERAAPAVTGLYNEADNDSRCIIAYLCGELRFDGCGPLLVEGMRDDNPPLRRISVAAAGKSGNPALIEEISSLMQDSDQEVRAGSIEALSRLAKDNPQDVLRIASVLANDGDPEKRRDAALLYGSLAERERLSLLVKDEDPLVRKTAVNALASLENGGGTAPLVMALVDEDADVRIAAAESLGESGGEEVLPALLLALKDEDPWVRCAALKSLGRLGHDGAREAVMDLLDGSTDGLLTITAMETLAKICGEGAVERVKRALSSSDEEVVKSAMEILSAYGDAWIDECLEMLLYHPHWDVRRNFIRFMVAAEGEKSLPHLRSAIDVEGDLLVREQILEILDRYR
jgi:HEAT repeat protein